MDIFDNNFKLQPHKSPAVSALVAFLVSIIGFIFIGPAIGFVLAMIAFPGSPTDFARGIANPDSPEFKLPLFIIQGSATFIGLFIIPAVYLKIVERISLDSLFTKPIGIKPTIMAGVITITFMTVNAVFIEWNANLTFPDFLDGFEKWARETEESAAELTNYLTDLDNFAQFMVAFIVIAIFAGLGEELVFRGMLQNMLHKATANIHLGIWISAFLFSAIHVQFFGFVPRLFLGALFGYLYYWSGNLWIPIFAHIVNNGFTLIMIYLHNLDVLGYDIENSEAAPLSAVLIFAIITFGLIYYFRNYFIKQNSTNG